MDEQFLVTLSVQPTTPNDFRDVYDDLVKLAQNYAVAEGYYTSLSSMPESSMKEFVHDSGDDEFEDLYHDDYTKTKVLDSIKNSLSLCPEIYANPRINQLELALNIFDGMASRGILFREASIDAKTNGTRSSGL